MNSWALRALDSLSDKVPCALISLLAVEGSAPRPAGTRMLVQGEGAFGSIGGGNLEFQAVKQARAILGLPAGSWRIQDYPLGPFLGQCCGGRVRLMVEHLDSSQSDWLEAVAKGYVVMLETELFEDRICRRTCEASQLEKISSRGPQPVAGDRFKEQAGDARSRLALFGAGHVGQALVRHLPGLPFDLRWFDSREGFAGYEGVQIAAPAELAQIARTAEGGLLIMTHDHALDYQLVSAALAGPAAFVGLIGSDTKRARFRGRLLKDGYNEEDLERLKCPIGIAGIPGKAPDIIAISVIAQLLQLQAGGLFQAKAQTQFQTELQI